MSRRFDDLSQEIAVVIDASGAISYRDNRAEEVIGDAASLRALATPGTEEKVDRLVTRVLPTPPTSTHPRERAAPHRSF